MSENDKPSEATDKPSEAADKPSEATDKPSEATDKPSGPRSAVLPEPELPGQGTTDGELLRRARGLYELGDYAAMRTVLTPLTRAKDPAVADAANALLRRIQVDPVQLGFLAGCLAAIVAIALHYLS